jgi:hypothetical protein
VNASRPGEGGRGPAERSLPQARERDGARRAGKRSRFIAARAAATLCLGAALALAPPVAAAHVKGLRGPFGRGTSQVWVLAPTSPIRAVVVFGHGWKVAPPSAGYPWVGQFEPWLEHLLSGGSAVIFPRYQLGLGDPQDLERVRAFLIGARSGFARLGRPRVPVVAVGYSFGASLALTYAATYRAWNLPAPRAVMAIFPSGFVAGLPLPPLDPSIRVLIQVGDADVVAGASGAEEYWGWLADHPASRKQFEIVRSGPGFTATHAAPKLATLAARRAFWAPLDRLIAEARRR